MQKFLHPRLGLLNFWPLLFFLLSLFLLAGCGSKLKPGCYRVGGQTYCVLKSAKGFRQVGLATYYAERFHGRTTASGQIFNKNALTCAHTILPFGTMVRVTNLSNRKQVIVTVNDRGPFKRKRVIDLSPRAAQTLDFIREGQAKVLVEYVGSKKLRK
ncbi:MAG: septal ring lytic transglycosylase RlpA family protein [Desulfovibrio sp.]|nr:septal ring lytic transglycosylase RlpA family protein [Desulfovibrio sp.]